MLPDVPSHIVELAERKAGKSVEQESRRNASPATKVDNPFCGLLRGGLKNEICLMLHQD